MQARRAGGGIFPLPAMTSGTKQFASCGSKIKFSNDCKPDCAPGSSPADLPARDRLSVRDTHHASPHQLVGSAALPITRTVKRDALAATSLVVARLDRAIQYSGGAGNPAPNSRKPLAAWREEERRASFSPSLRGAGRDEAIHSFFHRHGRACPAQGRA
jgi:hypothetical protein